MGIEKFIQLLIDQIKHLIPIAIVYQYQGGVMYKFGRFLRELEPGWHFKFPYIHTYAVINNVDTTLLISAQTVICSDGVELTVRGSVGYHILNVADYFNNVEDQKSAINDRTEKIIRECASVTTSEDFIDMDFGKILQNILQKEVDKYGIEIDYVVLVEVSKARSIKLFNETSNLIV